MNVKIYILIQNLKLWNYKHRKAVKRYNKMQQGRPIRQLIEGA